MRLKYSLIFFLNRRVALSQPICGIGEKILFALNGARFFFCPDHCGVVVFR